MRRPDGVGRKSLWKLYEKANFVACAAAGATILIPVVVSPHWRMLALPLAPIIAGFFLAASWIVGTRTHPSLDDLRRPDSRTVYYRTASFSLPPGLVLTALAIPVIVAVATAASLPPKVSYPMPIYIELLYFTHLAILIVALGAVNYALLPLLSFGAVWGFRIGKRLYLVSLGYCEGEVIYDPNVGIELPGFRVLAEFPLESERRLRVRIGYFPPGVYRVELPERDFFFLRTRGACVLRDPSLPWDDEAAFKAARYWEKFSMVYAALCLEEGSVPNPERVQKVMKRVENNSRKGLRVTYFGVTIPFGNFTVNKDTYMITYVLPIASLVAAITLLKGWQFNLRIAVTCLWLTLFWLLSCALVAWPVARRNKKTVTSGRWYRMITKRYRVQRKVLSLSDDWFPALRKIFDPLED